MKREIVSKMKKETNVQKHCVQYLEIIYQNIIMLYFLETYDAEYITHCWEFSASFIQKTVIVKGLGSYICFTVSIYLSFNISWYALEVLNFLKMKVELLQSREIKVWYD